MRKILVFFIFSISFLLSENISYQKYQGEIQKGSIIYKINFSDYSDGEFNSSDWICKEGEFIIRNGKLYIKSEKSNPRVFFKNQITGDVTLSISIMIEKIHWLRINLFEYAFEINEEHNNFSLLKNEKNNYREISSKSQWKRYVKDRGNFNIMIGVKGDEIVVYVDNFLIFAHEEMDLKKKGYMSFSSGWGSKWYIKEITLFNTISLPEKVDVSLEKAKDGIKKGLLLYIPFENDVKPAYGKGSTKIEAKGGKYEMGVVSNSIYLNEGEYVEIPAKGNMKREKGTISFWTKPDLNINDTSFKGHRILFTVPWIQISLYTPTKMLFFMTGADREKEFKWDYSVGIHASNLKPDRWHHIVVTWNSETGNKSLYIDGELQSTCQTTLIANKPFVESDIIFLGKSAPGKYDELFIWDRELDEEEIILLSKYPEYVSEVLLNSIKSSEKFSKPALKFYLKKIFPPVKTIISPGEIFVSEIPVENVSSQEFKGTLIFYLLDFWERERDRTERDIFLKPGEKIELKIPFKGLENGVFKVRVRIKGQENNFEKDVSCFAVWPEPKGEPDINSFFGNHVNAWFEGAFIEQAARLGLGWMRNHNMLQTTWWKWVEPEQGDFKFLYDFQLEYIKKYKMPVLGQFFATPYWAAKDVKLTKEADKGYPHCSFPDFNFFERYVYTTVSHYKDYIKYWEVWNEPELGSFWKGTPEEYARLCEIAYKSAKKADPDCKVLVGGFTPAYLKWQEEAAKAGAFKYADIISTHIGCSLKSPEEFFEEVKGLVNFYKEMSIKYGKGYPLPIWSTEGGTPDTTWLKGMDYPDLPPEEERTPMNWKLGAIRTIQGEIIHQICGIEKHFYYLQNSVAEGKSAYINTSMLEVTNAPRPKLIARVVFASQIENTDLKGFVRRDEGRFWAVVYQKKDGGKCVVVLWVGDGGKAKLFLSSGLYNKITKFTNIMGNDFSPSNPVEITEEPFYIHINASPEVIIKELETSKIEIVIPPYSTSPPKEEDKPDIPFLTGYSAPLEDPDRVFFVDIGPYCNMGFADDKPGDGKGGWSDEGPLNDMRNFPTGRQVFYNVPFNIINPEINNGKSIITLYGKSATPLLPEKIEGIKVGKKVKCLYFLHCAAWGGGLEGAIGKYIIHYSDGQKEEVPILIPENTNDWWKGYHKKENSKPVPIRVTNTLTGKPEWRYVRVWEWYNPRKDAEIEKIDFISTKGQATPILIAITGILLE